MRSLWLIPALLLPFVGLLFMASPVAAVPPGDIPQPDYCWDFNGDGDTGHPANVLWRRVDDTPSNYEAGLSGLMLAEPGGAQEYWVVPVSQNVAGGYTLAGYFSLEGYVEIDGWQFQAPSATLWDGSDFHNWSYTTLGSFPPTEPLAVSRFSNGTAVLATGLDAAQIITGTVYSTTFAMQADLVAAGMDEVAFWFAPLSAEQLELLTAEGWTCASLMAPPPTATPPIWATPTPLGDSLPVGDDNIDLEILPPAWEPGPPIVTVPDLEIAWDVDDTSWLVSIMRYVPIFLVENELWPIALWGLVLIVSIRVVIRLSQPSGGGGGGGSSRGRQRRPYRED